jgi:AcrR family transcriptional regulator
MTRSGRPNSRQAILDAAVDLLADVGAAHLTLDAVAQRAGISKGGLLYNFPTKNALLAAMIEHHVASATALLGEVRPDDKTAVQGAVRQQFEERFSWLCDAARKRTAHSMLAAIAEQPQLLEPVRHLHRMLWEKVAVSGADPHRLWIAWLAGEGLLFHQMFGLSPLSPEDYDKLVRILKADADALQEPQSAAAE